MWPLIIRTIITFFIVVILVRLIPLLFNIFIKKLVNKNSDQGNISEEDYDQKFDSMIESMKHNLRKQSGNLHIHGSDSPKSIKSTENTDSADNLVEIKGTSARNTNQNPNTVNLNSAGAFMSTSKFWTDVEWGGINKVIAEHAEELKVSRIDITQALILMSRKYSLSSAMEMTEEIFKRQLFITGGQKNNPNDNSTDDEAMINRRMLSQLKKNFFQKLSQTTSFETQTTANQATSNPKDDPFVQELNKWVVLLQEIKEIFLSCKLGPAQISAAYQLLELPENTPWDKVKKKFNQLAMRYHPDRVEHDAFPGEIERLNQKFSSLNAAQELIHRVIEIKTRIAKIINDTLYH